MRQEPVIKCFSFSYYITYAIVVAFFPIYFDSLGYSKIQIGSLFSIGPAVGIFSNLIWGLLSDRYQTLKKTIIIVLFGQLAMILLMFQTGIYSAIFIIMAAFYFFQTPLNALNDSQILLQVRSTGKSYASFRVWGSIGFACSAVVIGKILSLTGMGWFAGITVGSVALSLSIAFLLKDSRQGMQKMDLSGVWKIVFSRRLIWFLLLVLLMSVSHRFNDGFLSLYMKEMGADKVWIGYAMMASSLSEIPVFLFLSKYGHRYRELPMLAVASLAYTLRFFLMSLVSDPVWAILIQAMHSVSFGIFFVTAMRYMQDLVPDEYRATGQAVFNVVWGGCAGLISGVAGGRIYDLWGGAAMYRYASMCAAAAFVGFMITHFLQNRGNGRNSLYTKNKGETSI